MLSLCAGMAAARALIGTEELGPSAATATSAVRIFVRLAGGNGSRSLLADSTAPVAWSTTMYALGGPLYGVDVVVCAATVGVEAATTSAQNAANDAARTAQSPDTGV